MDNVFGSPQLNRKLLRVNNRTSVKQEFGYDANLGYKSVATPSVVTWKTPGKGVQGESVNATNNAARLIINRQWKPIQS